jgi:hypothetical protein
MSRIQISLSTPTLDQLRAIAHSTGEPVARVATRMLMAGFADGRSAPCAPSRPATSDIDEAAQEPAVPSWLEPFDEEERRIWRQQAWGDALALYNRYPSALANLPESWWCDTDLFEIVCAMAAWRLHIDCAGRDPRDELAFHHQLADFRYVLDHLPGGVTTRFKPGAVPDWSID